MESNLLKVKFTSKIELPFDLKIFQSGCWLNGGSARDIFFDITPNDWDIFSPNLSAVKKVMNYFKPTKAVITHASSNLIRYKLNGQKIDVVKKFNLNGKDYKSIEDGIFCSDLTVCQFAFDGEYIYWTDKGIQDYQNKILNYVNLDFWGGKERFKIRLDKYLKYGYSLSQESETKLREAQVLP